MFVAPDDESLLSTIYFSSPDFPAVGQKAPLQSYSCFKVHFSIYKSEIPGYFKHFPFPATYVATEPGMWSQN